MQTESQRRASRAVENWMAGHDITNAALVAKTKADKGTIGTFLAGDTWPRRQTLAKIESALGWAVGTITDIAEGRVDPPAVEEPVSASPQNDDSLLFRRPDGLTDRQWVEMQERMRRGWEWEISQAAGER